MQADLRHRVSYDSLVMDLTVLPDGRRFVFGGGETAYVVEHGLAP